LPPVCPWHFPFFTSLLNANIEQFQQAIFIQESLLGVGQFSELAMYCINRIGGINWLPNRFRIFEIGTVNAIFHAMSE